MSYALVEIQRFKIVNSITIVLHNTILATFTVLCRAVSLERFREWQRRITRDSLTPTFAYKKRPIDDRHISRKESGTGRPVSGKKSPWSRVPNRIFAKRNEGRQYRCIRR